MTDSPDSPTASVENGIVTEIIQLSLFQDQNKLSRLFRPSSISSYKTFSNLQSPLLGKLHIRENICCNGCQQLFIFHVLKDQAGKNLFLINWQQSFC